MFDPKRGEVYTAADGGRYGYVVLKPADEHDEVEVLEVTFKEVRTINRFKMSYRYKPLLEEGEHESQG